MTRCELNHAGSRALSHHELSIQISFLFMFLYKCYYTVVFFKFIMQPFLFFTCYTNPLQLKQPPSFSARSLSYNSPSAKNSNYFLSQFVVNQHNSVGSNPCLLITTPPGLCFFKLPTKWTPSTDSQISHFLHKPSWRCLRFSKLPTAHQRKTWNSKRDRDCQKRTSEILSHVGYCTVILYAVDV